MVHNMDRQRITVSLPQYLADDLIRQIPAGQVSRFVSQAIEKEMMKAENDPVTDFINLRKSLPRFKKEAIMEAIKKGRQ